MKEVSGRGAVGRMLRRWRLWIWTGVAVLLLGVGLGWVPLFNVLGYELAAVVSLFAALAGLDIGAAYARELQWLQEPAIVRASYPGRALTRSTCVASALAVGLVLPPALIAAIRGMWIPTCDWAFGIKAYVAMPLITAALAGAIGHAIGVAAGSRKDGDRRFALGFVGVLALLVAVLVAIIGTFAGALLVGAVIAAVLGVLVYFVKPHRSTLLALVPFLLIAATSLYRLYDAPPVFMYNAVLGYFPGNLYDENIQLGWPLVWSRLEQLAWVIAVVAMVAARLDVPRFRITREPRPAALRIAPVIVAITFITVGIALHIYGGPLGYRIDSDEIQAELGGRLETEHFIIHYSKTPELEKEIALIAADHEFRYAQVVKQIGVAPPGKLRSFYFANREQKARWIGAKDVEMAKPWRREIYLEHRAFPHGSLRHEIAHAVASAFGNETFGVPVQTVAGIPLMASPGLIEGFAVALDWPAGFDRLTPHEAVRAMQAMGVRPPIRELLSLQFLTVSSARSYMTAGSFVKFLLDTYGAPALRELYRDGNFARAYGKSFVALEQEWLVMIAGISLPAEEIEGNRERFRQGSVFARPCPHANAARRERALHAYVAGNRARAVALMRAVCKDAPEEPRYKLELGDYLFSGIGAEFAEAIALWTALAEADTVTSSLRADAFDRLARAAARTGDLTRTKALIERASKLPVDANARRQLEAQTFALNHEGPAGAALRGYFFAPPGTWDGPSWALLATLAEPQLGLGHYLYGLQKSNASEWADAAEALDVALGHGLPSPSFVRNAARRLAVAAFRANDTKRVERAIATLRSDGMTASDRLLADDWAARLAFGL